MIESKEKNFYDENEMDEIINYLSYELILENLKKQIMEDEGYGDVNYLEVFNEKFNYVILTYGDNQEVVDKLNRLRDEFYNTTLVAIQDKFGFKLTFKDILIKEELYGVINVMYDFFIINIVEGLTTFYTNYIRKESKNIIKSFKNQINFKDLYFSLLKKKLNKENSILVYSITKVIDTIELEYIEDFIDLVVKEDEDEYNNFIMNKLFNTEEFIDDVICDMNVFKNIIKRKIRENSAIQQSVRTTIFNELKGKDE